MGMNVCPKCGKWDCSKDCLKSRLKALQTEIQGTVDLDDKLNAYTKANLVKAIKESGEV